MFILSEHHHNSRRIKISEPTFTTSRFDRVTLVVPTPHKAMQLRGMHRHSSNPMKQKFAFPYLQRLLATPSSGSETWGNCVLHGLCLEHPAMPAKATLANRHHLEIDTIRMRTENKRDVCYKTVLNNTKDISLLVQLQEISTTRTRLPKWFIVEL